MLKGWRERLRRQEKRHVREVLSRVCKSSDATAFCDGYVLGNSHRKPFHTGRDRPNIVGELINAELNGPMSVDSINCFRYYVIFKVDFSRFVRIFFMKHKFKVAQHFDTFLNECKTAGHKVKTFRSDCGTEFECRAVLTLLQERGIKF